MYKRPATDYHRAVEEFKRELLTKALAAHGGNRTHAARSLGLQRTYLLRLIREFEISGLVPAGRRPSKAATPAARECISI